MDPFQRRIDTSFPAFSDTPSDLEMRIGSQASPNNHLVNLIPQHPKIAGDYETPLPLQPRKKKITHITKNRKNKNFAIPADAAAIPPNPSTAAMSAIIRNVTAQPNIVSPPCYKRIASIPCGGCSELLYFRWLM